MGVVFAKRNQTPHRHVSSKKRWYSRLSREWPRSYQIPSQNWSPSRIVYFIDNRQALHFRQLFATAKSSMVEHWTLNLADVELTHAGNGFVSLPDGDDVYSTWSCYILKTSSEKTLIEWRKYSKNAKEHSQSDTKSSRSRCYRLFFSQPGSWAWLIFEWDKVLHLSEIVDHISSMPMYVGKR